MKAFQWLKRKNVPVESYDHEQLEPVIRCSICNGEQVACFRDRQSGRFTEIMLLRSEDDLRMFCEKYGITENIKRIY